MHFGLVMECDYRYGATEGDAFQEAFDLMDVAENEGLDGVWLAERHFAAPKNPLDAMGAGIPSIVSSPLIMSSAIAARTKRIRIGVAVNVLPLNHPVRMAEEVATIDQISKGRVDFGVGRSGFARSYEGYGIPYAESRERFQECLDVILNAWTHERFSHHGKHYTFDDVCVLPKPYQQPHPPLRVAATTMDTFPRVGADGYPIFVGLRGMDRGDLAKHLAVYRQSWREAGHPGEGSVYLRIPIYVGGNSEDARREPEESTMRSYHRMARAFATSVAGSGTTVSEERAERGRRLAQVTYEDLLQDRLAYGDAKEVASLLRGLQEELQLSGFIAETNVGGLIPREKVLESVRRFAVDVVPALR